MEAQYGKFLDIIRAVRINVPLVDVLAGMPNYGKFLKDLISDKNKIEQISAAFLSDESSAMIQNKVLLKLGDPGSLLIPCNFNKAFSCNALADLGASINLMPYLLYAKLSLGTLKPSKMSVRLADRSFQYPVRIDENMLVEVDEILKEDFDALLDEGSQILHSIEGTIIEEKLFAEFDEFIAIATDENAKNETKEEPEFKKIIINTDYKIKTSLEEPPTDLELNPLLVGLEVDKAKINIISKLPPSNNIKDTPFEFNSECQSAFELLKEKLTCAPVIVSPNWNLPFELMCDASDFAVGAILEFDIEIKDRKGIENVAADHLSRIENNETSDDSEVDDNFLGETLMIIDTSNEPWFADFVNYLTGEIIPKRMTYQQKKKFFSDLKNYFWEEPYLFKVCFDGMIRRCISGPETQTILDQCHHGPTGGHYGPNITAKKVLDLGFYWPTIIKEAHTLVCLCKECQKTRNISKRDEMPLNNIQVCENFNIWGIDFMGPFLKSHKFEYILVAVDYVSKWVEAQALPTNDARVVITFLKKLFSRFRIPKALISDRGTHFCNKIMEKTIKRYRVNHRFSTSYHPQTIGQVENTNTTLKRILEKTVKDNSAI
ncbi:reverse transcriptase domain-containing protein [Tanacetum coccineum]|uniref:Reverse transcriptase domain-containing protein n=1 Tax=Tanacetum coccineum TaxID=301880 RepID=A0ABQ4YVJ4_9ASTR